MKFKKILLFRLGDIFLKILQIFLNADRRSHIRSQTTCTAFLLNNQMVV